MLTRRNLFKCATAAAFSGFAGAAGRPHWAITPGEDHSTLLSDPAGLLDLPAGFSYRVLSEAGAIMSDGLVVPDRADGMGAFFLDSRRIALVRNHELGAGDRLEGPFAGLAARVPDAVYDRTSGGEPLPGGTTTIVIDSATGRLEAEYLSLAGTLRNCAGGATPWGSWLSCEEDVSREGPAHMKDHGWVFEVPVRRRGLTDPVPLYAMGRFRHEAAAVDPRSGIVYLTEDREDGLFYRFLPHRPGRLSAGGSLQALAFIDSDLRPDSRNWQAEDLAVAAPRRVRWIDLDGVVSPDDDLRSRGHCSGAVLFARGEGVHFGRGELYFCCTSGGAARIGQIMRYRPSRFEGRPTERDEPGRLELFVESDAPGGLRCGDNLTITPAGHVLVCEDQDGSPLDNHLRGISPDGRVYDFARLHVQTELAGACFAPGGATMFVNVYKPAKTLAISGPWLSLQRGNLRA